MTRQAEAFMKKALELAARGKGLVEPNPMVGALLVKGGTIIGSGFHKKFGGPHAEVNALSDAKNRARGSTLYVTLAPCCHQGKTPPCTRAIIKAGVRKVIAAMEDPNPLVKGKGFNELKAAGIDVEIGVLEEEARLLNAPYIKLATKGIPYFTAKWAMTLDGKISTFTGDSKWVSCAASRREAHRLRGLASAVMVGINTVVRDDPLLTVRNVRGKNPARIIVDSRGRLSVKSKLVQSIDEAPVYVATTERADDKNIKALSKAGCTILTCPAKNKRVDLQELAARLGKMQLTNVIIEGGSELLGDAFDEGLIDRVAVFVAPKIIGGAGAKTPLAGTGIEKIADAVALNNVAVTHLDCDILIEGDVS